MRWRVANIKWTPPRWKLLALLVLCRCAFAGTSGADEAFSGSSAARPAREITGGVFVGPGAGGISEAEDLARRNCERYQLKAEAGRAVTVNGSVRLTYSCQ